MAHIGLFLSTYQAFYNHCSQAIGHCIKSCNQIIAKVVGTSVNQSESAIVSEIQIYNESVDYGINNIMYEADMYDLNNDSLSINLEADTNDQQQSNTQQAAKPSGNVASKAQGIMSKASEFIKSKFGKFVDWIKKIIKWCRDKISEAWTKFQSFAEKVKADLNDVEVQISVIDNLKELAGGSLPNNLDPKASIKELEKIAQEYEGKEFKTSTQTVHGSAGLNLVRDMITSANSAIKYLEGVSNKVEAFNKETQSTLAAKTQTYHDNRAKQGFFAGRQATNDAERDRDNYRDNIIPQRNAFYRAAKAVVQYELKVVQTILKTSREAEAKILGKAANKSEATIVAVIESYNNALDYDVSGFIYEAETSDIDDVIERATSGDAQGVTDVNHASTEVIPSAASTDPNALNYDKTNVYSQDTPIGDENTAGTIEREIKTDTTTTVTPGNETKALEAFEGWLDKFADLQLA